MMMRHKGSEPELDAFLCTCGPCKQFWKNAFPDVSTFLHHPPSDRATGTCSVPRPSSSVFRYGDRVLVQGKHTGIVQYIGFLDDEMIAPKLYAGVKLDDNINSVHNGVYNGKRYFNCPRGHGIMVKASDVRPLPTANPRPQVSGNSMFPSFTDVCKRRKDREKKLTQIYSDAQVNKSFSGTSPSRRPQISPRPNKAATLRQTSAPSIFTTKDPHDIALQDEKRKEKKKMELLEAVVDSPEERQLKQWQRSLNNKENGEQMITTLKKLQQAYQKGLNLTRRHRSSDEDSDS